MCKNLVGFDSWTINSLSEGEINEEFIPELGITSLYLEFGIINRSSDSENSFETLIDLETNLILGCA
jgi:hypothetical protein